MNLFIRNHLNQAAQFLESGDLAVSESHINEALRIDPKCFNAHHLLGIIKGRQGNTIAAVKALKIALSINPNDGVLHFNLAKAMMDNNQYEDSIPHHQIATQLMSTISDSWINYGYALKELGQYDLALNCFDKAININENDAEAFSNKGVVLKELNRLEDALHALDNAIALKPDYHEAWSNKGVVLKELNRLEDALHALDNAIALKPDYHEAWCNRGIVLDELRLYTHGLHSYDKAIDLQPNYDDAYWNKSLNQLITGNFKEGWKNYEYRWNNKNVHQMRFQEIPVLDSLNKAFGKRILVWSEQGYGDTIQFSRFINNLTALNIDVVFEVQEPLLKIMQESFKYVKVINRSESPGNIDFQVALLSLPLLLSVDIESIPKSQSYISVDQNASDSWNKRLKLSKQKKNIGIACSGSPTYLNDKNRSLDLCFLRSIAEKTNLYLIQKSLRDNDQIFLSQHPEIHFLGNEIDSFQDTAAIVHAMDLIISVDTSLAHLSAAMGKQTLILLPWASEWRWLINRDDSPWYPTAKLFRQSNLGNWAEVIEDVCASIKAQ